MVLRTFAYPAQNYPWCEWPCGRFLLLPLALPREHKDDLYIQRRVLYGVTDCLTEKDILSLALFQNKSRQPYGQAWFEPLPDYEDTLALIKEIGPGLRGVAIGQQGVELSYRYLYHAWDGDAIGNICACTDFVKRVGGMLRDMGVKPVFLPMDWDVLQDWRFGGGRLLDVLNDLEAPAYVACGYTLVPGAFVKEAFFESPRGEQLRALSQWSGKGWRDPAPDEDFPDFRAYLQAGQFWSGLCGIDGIRAGNIEKLTAFGFKGFATKLDEPWWIEELEKERGPEWWA
jgi:hypothetical protein